MEGIIKSVRIEPMKLNGSTTTANVFVEVDTKALYDLYTKNGINTANIMVPYVYTNNGAPAVGYISLRTAYNNKREVGIYTALTFGATDD